MTQNFVMSLDLLWTMNLNKSRTSRNEDPNNPNMSSASNETEKKDAIKIGQQQGVVQPGTGIYDCITSIILNAKQIKEELTDSKDTMTDIFYVKPHGEPKPNGFNILTGTTSYIVTYQISCHRNILPQTQITNAQSVGSTAKVLKEVFLTEDVTKDTIILTQV